MLDTRQAFDLAVRNISRWGDTDVFPFSPENHVLHDKRDEVVDLLMEVHANFDDSLLQFPAIIDGALSLVTYEGFRWVTQIEPLWNAYFLGLVLKLSPELEAARIPRHRAVVFSYRLAVDQERSSLFSDGAWAEFSERSAALSEQYEYVVICDIADFYSRVYHHRLQNALQLLPGVDNVPARIEKLVREFSGGPSYGLPVGGPAARLLAELALNRTDRLLLTNGVVFCRYADDYRLFAQTRNDAFRALLYLSEILLRNEGLTLQRQKTRVLMSKDFARSPLFTTDDVDELNPVEREERRFLRLSLRFDPYSATAAEDYERLREDLRQFDIMGMLTREVGKSRVNTAVVRRLAQAVRHLDEDIRNAAAETLIGNLETLAPALPVTLRVLEELLPDLSETLRSQVPAAIRETIIAGDYYLQVPVNLAYALRVLQHDRAEENVTLASDLFDKVQPFIQRDIVYLMYIWNADYWLSDKRRQWNTQHPWVKRALLLASYSLGDEGRFWRRSLGDQVAGFDAVCRDWMRERVQAGRTAIDL
jgi:hypothetical protein